jgi:large conductance mechanosensitive channel
MFKEFKEFAIKGNAMDMAIGIIIGAAFGAIVKSMVDDVIMPPIGLLLGNVDFSNLFIVLKAGKDAAASLTTLAQAKAAGAVTLNYGAFINVIVSFIIISFTVFLLIKAINRFKKASEPSNTRDCPYCLLSIPKKASRCSHCTSEIKPLD